MRALYHCAPTAALQVKLFYLGDERGMTGRELAEEREGPLGDDGSPSGPVDSKELEQKALEVGDGRRQLVSVAVDAPILRRIQRKHDRGMDQAET